ncbi:hypothetical protein [Floridanema aerugineum]|uniref:Uncharacterized protein n=1 Tax=Floridaenema aerugineum BLCC-F46 TaxID=3153654 RepID=A0ABV4XGA6_9CYAN
MANTTELAPIPQIPSYSDLKDLPISPVHAIWVVSMAAFPMILWGLKAVVDARVENIKAVNQARIEEDKRELAQRDELIKHLQQQNNTLINEIFIMRRTLDYSGELGGRNVKR